MHTADEECVTREHSSVFAVLHEVADAVLRVARCIQRPDLYALADFKGLAVLGRLGDCVAILAADDWSAAELLELNEGSVQAFGQTLAELIYHLLVPTGMVPMTEEI